MSQASSWAAWYNSRLLVELTLKGLVFFFLPFLSLPFAVLTGKLVMLLVAPPLPPAQ